MNNFMNIALEEAELGYKEGEIPVGAVIVSNNKILCRTHNEKEKYKNALKHAELLAINHATNLIGDWRLNECDIYITMEPCLMCVGALIQCRIKNIYYLIDNTKFRRLKNLNINKYNHKINIIKIDDEKLINNYKELLKTFFKDKR